MTQSEGGCLSPFKIPLPSESTSRGQKATSLGAPSGSPSSPNNVGRAFGITSWRYMVTLARSPRTGILRYISNFICFGVLFLLFKRKTKKITLLHMLWNMCPNVIDSNDLLWFTKTVALKPVADSRLSGWDWAGWVADFWRPMKGSGEDTISWNVDSCILLFDVVLQDVCGNVHLYLDICYVPFFF